MALKSILQISGDADDVDFIMKMKNDYRSLGKYASAVLHDLVEAYKKQEENKTNGENLI